MRLAWGLLLLCGCDLYFGSGTNNDPPADDQPTINDARLPVPVDAQGPECSQYICRNGVVYSSIAMPNASGCSTPVETMSHTCELGCAFENEHVPLSFDPCAKPPLSVHTCSKTGTCTSGQFQSCSAPTLCGPVTIGLCACDNASWACQSSCNSGLCSATDVQAAIAGTWKGTASSVWATYGVTIRIATDGRWMGDAEGPYIPFYYGDDGGTPGSRIWVESQTDIGAYARIGLFGGSQQGQLTEIVVDAHSLRFTMLDAWLGCSRMFRYDLTR